MKINSNLISYLTSPVEKIFKPLFSCLSFNLSLLIQKIKRVAQEKFNCFKRDKEAGIEDSRPNIIVVTEDDSDREKVRKAWNNKFPQNQPAPTHKKDIPTNHSSKSEVIIHSSVKEENKLNKLKASQNLHRPFQDALERYSKSKEESEFLSFKKLLKANAKNDAYLINRLNEEGEPLFFVICTNLPAHLCMDLLKDEMANIDFGLISSVHQLNILQFVFSKNDGSLEWQKWMILLFVSAFSQEKVEVFLQGKDQDQSPLQFLLQQLKNAEKPKTLQERQLRLKQEWFFYYCVKGLRELSRKCEKSVTPLMNHLKEMKTQTDEQGCISEGSKLVLGDQDKVLALELGLDMNHVANSHLFRMDQGLDAEGEKGTTISESLTLTLKHLINFLLTPDMYAESFNVIYPIAERLAFFTKEIAPRIFKELKPIVETYTVKSENARILALQIVKDFLTAVDNDHSFISLDHVADQIAGLGWPGHLVAVGVIKIDKDTYCLTVANGGDGLPFHSIYEEKDLYSKEGDFNNYQPLKIVQGSRVQMEQVLTKMFLLRAESKENENHAKEFYETLSGLIEIHDFNLPKARKQDIENCGLHNFKELIFHLIQRKEALICKKWNLSSEGNISYSIANQWQSHIHETGKQQLKANPFISEGAFVTFKTKEVKPLQAITTGYPELVLKSDRHHYILPFKPKTAFKVNLKGEINICDDYFAADHTTVRLRYDEKRGKVIFENPNKLPIKLYRSNVECTSQSEDLLKGDILSINKEFNLVVE